MGELAIVENRLDRDLKVDVMREVDVDFVDVDVGVLGRVYTCEVLVLD